MPAGPQGQETTMSARAATMCLALALLVAPGCSDDDPAGTGGQGASGGSTGSGGSGASGASGGSGSGGSSSTSTGGSGGSGAANGSGGAEPAICPPPPWGDDPIPDGASVELVEDGFDFLEGPVWRSDLGALFFSNMHMGQPNDRPLNGPKGTMHKLVPPSDVSVFVDNSSTNGLATMLDGSIIGCAHGIRGLELFDPVSAARTTFLEDFEGDRFNSPNDVTIRSDGNIYFTDPDWQLTQPAERPQAVYRIAPGKVVSVITELNKPNGITLSPDEQYLYVGASDGQVRRFPLDADGTPGEPETFAQTGGNDGMAIDCAGNLYVTAQGNVVVLSPEGDELGIIDVPGSTTNAAFGGAERKTLYITAGSSLYSIELAIPGYPY
ncbi:MAG: SMP-30/gluconolactonase/LRE family protein [Polyangiaceae bacterium]